MRILGPVQVERDGEIISIDLPKERAVLATLALHAGQIATNDELVAALWGDDPPASATRSLHSHVSRLRERIGAALVETAGRGYRLACPGDAIDATRLESLVHEAQEALDHDDPQRALRTASNAVELWLGEPLTDLSDGDTRRGNSVRLGELHLLARELRVEAELALGQHEVAVGTLERLVVEHPLRESLWAHLMVALYRCGRQADALRTYRRLQRILADQLGIEPSPAVSRLERRILRQDPQLDVVPPPPPTNLPVPVSSFVGREDEVRKVVERVGEHRLVTLLGPGGVGKTRIALAAADRIRDAHPDGVWWVDLALARSRGEVRGAVATALGLVAPAGATLADTLVTYVRLRDMVLVLDNCEHVVEAAAEIAASLLEAATDLAVITTSRVPLGIAGESRVSIEPMELPPPEAPAPDLAAYDAVRLFLERLSDRSAGTLDDEELARATEICTTLEGLPLAIELAAARAPLLGVRGVADRLTDGIGLLSASTSDLRHGSLRAALDWSYELLDESAGAVFDRLAVFSGDFDLAAAVAVGDVPETPDGDPLSVMSRLVEASMVLAVAVPGGANRYRLLEPLREYGLEHLRELGIEDAVRQRHADHYRQLVQSFEPLGGSAVRGDVYDHINADAHHLRAAVAWSLDHESRAATLGFANAIGELWYQAGDMHETVESIEAMLDGAGDAPVALTSWARFRLVWPTFMSGDMARALQIEEVARASFEARGDHLGLVAALHSRAHMITLGTGDVDEALQWYEAALDAAESPGLELERAQVLVETAQALALADRPDAVVRGLTVREMLGVADEVFRRGEVELGLAHASMARWMFAAATGDQAAIGPAAEAGIAHAHAAQNRMFEQINLVGMGNALLMDGDLDAAELRLLEAAQLALEEGNLLQLAPPLFGLAAVAGARDAAERAARLWGAGMRLGPPWALVQRTLYEPYVAPALRTLGERREIEFEAGRSLTPDRAVALAFSTD